MPCLGAMYFPFDEILPSKGDGIISLTTVTSGIWPEIHHVLIHLRFAPATEAFVSIRFQTKVASFGCHEKQQQLDSTVVHAAPFVTVPIPTCENWQTPSGWF